MWLKGHDVVCLLLAEGLLKETYDQYKAGGQAGEEIVRRLEERDVPVAELETRWAAAQQLMPRLRELFSDILYSEAEREIQLSLSELHIMGAMAAALRSAAFGSAMLNAMSDNKSPWLTPVAAAYVSTLSERIETARRELLASLN